MRFDLLRRKEDVLCWGCGIFESVLPFLCCDTFQSGTIEGHHPSKCWNSRQPRETISIAAARSSCAWRRLITDTGLSAGRNWAGSLCRLLCGSGENYEIQGKWSTWMARLLPSEELQAHAELTPPWHASNPPGKPSESETEEKSPKN